MNFLSCFARLQYLRALRVVSFVRAFLKLYAGQSDFRVGSILCKRGGYVQEYYQVVAMRGKTVVVLREIAMFVRPDDEYTIALQTNVIPAKDNFVGPEETFKVGVHLEWSGIRQCLEYALGIKDDLIRFRKESGYATYHPYVPGLDARFGGHSQSETKVARDLPFCMQRITVDASRCIVTVDFDRFARENDYAVSSAMIARMK